VGLVSGFPILELNCDFSLFTRSFECQVVENSWFSRLVRDCTGFFSVVFAGEVGIFLRFLRGSLDLGFPMFWWVSDVG
jgi:hypothetical protein